MKKANVAPVHKKVTNRFLKIPTRVFTPICETIFEQLIFNKLHEFFIEKEIIFSSQSGFKPGDSYISQLLSITHDIYQFFENVLKLGVSSLTYLRLLLKFDIKFLFIMG